MGGGFQRICKIYGAIVINGQRFVWDYANDEGVPEDEMPMGSERHAASERARAKFLSDELSNETEGTSNGKS